MGGHDVDDQSDPGAAVSAAPPSSPEVERPVDLTILATIEAELAEVDRALIRLDEGTYGTCQVCGAEMDAARLASEPTAAMCATHQSASGHC
jgi:RNA polymerase-binding transcription factor DksA